MSGVAIIGRQLRRQNTVTNSSPHLPPTNIYKEKCKSQYSPSINSSTFANARNSERSNGVHYPYSNANQINDQFAHRATKDGRSQLAREQKLQCTWHCFCVASKALCVGLVLIVAGSFMLAFGLIAQSDFWTTHSNFTDFTSNSTDSTFNSTSISSDDKSALALYRNLIYAGPVILGLGTLVLLASLTLTFESRDTLGKKTQNTSTIESKSIIAPLGHLIHSNSFERHSSCSYLVAQQSQFLSLSPSSSRRRRMNRTRT